ncbi:unnamed protein product [Porites evermanni]|uniref:Uncharacterized protein n=1 Tax=Porites evermanni TaxID=104178 RepID=A0ABN8M344_9CNID|nr:unnamed protein product [Porites evermanni]
MTFNLFKQPFWGTCRRLRFRIHRRNFKVQFLRSCYRRVRSALVQLMLLLRIFTDAIGFNRINEE